MQDTIIIKYYYYVSAYGLSAKYAITFGPGVTNKTEILLTLALNICIILVIN